MAQVSWLYLDDNGGKHRVGLYHGDRSGHLVIHCNMRVVQVDFSVKETRTYSFFIEDDLCEVRLWLEKNGVFSYEFEVNREADTPKNRILKQENRSNNWKIAGFFGGSLLVLCGLFFGIRAYNLHLREKNAAERGIGSQLGPENEQRLQLEGRTAVARLFLVQENGSRRVFYSFPTGENTQITGKLAVPDTGKIILPTGFELRDRDEFEATYLPTDPRIHQVRYDRPTQLQIQQYFRMAVATELGAHPEQGPRRAACLVSLARDERGWQSLADIIFQHAPAWENTAHNRDSYLRLVRDAGFSEKLKANCWDK